jgi:hypothetical protein
MWNILLFGVQLIYYEWIVSLAWLAVCINRPSILWPHVLEMVDPYKILSDRLHQYVFSQIFQYNSGMFFSVELLVTMPFVTT